MNIFDYADYRLYVQERIQKLPKRGCGEFQKIAKALGMHTSSISQVFKGLKGLTPELPELYKAFFNNKVISAYIERYSS